MFGFVSLLTAASVAAHAEPVNQVQLGLFTGSVYQEGGAVASKEATVSATYSRIDGPLTVSAINTTPLAGSYGHKSNGDEWKALVSYKLKADLGPLGPVEITPTVQYWAWYDLGDGADDILHLDVMLARPIDFGFATVKPYTQVIQWIGLGAQRSVTKFRGGMQFSVPVMFPFIGPIAINGDGAWTDNFTCPREATRLNLFIAKKFEAATVSFGMLSTEHIRTIYGGSVTFNL